MMLEEFYHASTELRPGNLVLDTDKELTQYFIKSWKLDYMNKGEM